MPAVLENSSIIHSQSDQQERLQPIRRRRFSVAAVRPSYEEYLNNLQQALVEPQPVNNAVRNKISFFSRGRRPSQNTSSDEPTGNAQDEQNVAVNTNLNTLEESIVSFFLVMLS